MVEVTARAKVFGVMDEYRFCVDETGTVRVFDEVAGHFTVCHSISDRVARRIARLAGVGIIDRSSPYSERAVAYVAANPGCTKWDLARHLTWHSRRCPSKQYYLVNTQIELGNIRAERKSNRYCLFVNTSISGGE